MQERCKSTSDRLAYYYFDFNDAANLTVSALLRSLVFQLCVGLGSLPDKLIRLHDECDHGRSYPSDDSLADILFMLMHTEEGKIYVLVDGLDESPAEPERSRLFDSVLRRIGDASGSYNFLFTSRNEYDIDEAMNGVSKHAKLYPIEIKTEDVDSDVRLHVKTFVAEHKRVSGWSKSVRQEIEDELVKGSQGM
jgi:hypothetical protein